MEDVASSLESLVQKATNPRNHITDTAAVVEICNVLNREPYCAHVATRAIASKIQSPQEWEALQALNLLDTCMKHCGVSFHAEVGKFRFLNEMIKLVSPKYLGGRTATAVRQRVLLLMHTWTVDYPRETKIREAYEMLKKQGVVKEEPPYISTQKDVSVPPPPPRPKNSIFEDEERSRLLQKLLQSKNPDDLQAANRLIKTMVKEDEYRVELNSRRVTELESVHNNARLLSEMLDQYRPGQTSAEELELIKELHQSCERLRPSVFRLASETQDNEAMLNEVLSASDELGQVFDKYTAIIVQGKRPEQGAKSGAASLLDLSTPSEEKLPPVPVELLSNQLADLGLDLGSSQAPAPAPENQSNLEVLGDIFASLAAPKTSSPNATSPGVHSILQPVTVQQKLETSPPESEKPSKLKALEDLDALGESLLKQSLPATCKLGSQFSRPANKVPMNLLTSAGDTGGGGAVPHNLDLDFLVSDAGCSADLINGAMVNGSGDDSMVDLSEDVAEEETGSIKEQNSRLAEALRQVSSNGDSPAVKPLTDISVSLESIKPGTVPPLTVLDEKNGISVILNFAKDSPRPDVSVIVVTTISKNSAPITNYLFQAVVPKTCKLRLQPPSGSDLPAHNPFLPPAAITQIMLIANPNNDAVSLKFMVSYMVDQEMVTEMGEVERLPLAA